MSKIRILPEQLANQIAAGEVVERPASVVKELLENSLDAGATRIEVEIEGGGTRLIRVIDDGEGMGEDDLLMSLERHGTSKIQAEEDLGAISTLGFRGEAIPSIGSVSKMVLISRPKGQNLGTRVLLEYGKLTKVHEIGCSFGTNIEVRSLFGNTPARRKFLRTTRTELGHIEEIIKNYGLGCPDITFILRVNGRESIYLDRTFSQEQRLARLLRYEGTFIPVSKRLTQPTPRNLSGFLVPPENISTGPAKLRFFVNGRAVKDRMASHAIAEGMRGFLMKGKNPSGLIHLELQPAEVDVNVHPAKHEVRFRSSRDIHTFISGAVAEALIAYQKSFKAAIFGSPVTENSTDSIIGIKPPLPEQPVPCQTSTQVCEVSKTKSFETSAPTETIVPPQAVKNTQQKQTKKPEIVPQPLLSTSEPMEHEPYSQTVPAPPFKHSSTTIPRTSHDLLVIGQLDDLYIFCRNSSGLLVIDQHAAHERLLYEKFRKQYLNGTIVKQTLMFPETIELSVFQTQLFENNEEEIEKMGFSVSNFGGNTFVISATPALGGLLNPAELFLDILEQFGSENRSQDHGTKLDSILSTMACKAAVKAGTSLSSQEIDKLLNDMVEADVFSHCPHGRPVARQFSKEEIKKWFHRT